MKLVIRYIGVPGSLLGDNIDLGTLTGSANLLIATISAILIIVYEIVP
jgi:hypothetical protein